MATSWQVSLATIDILPSGDTRVIADITDGVATKFRFDKVFPLGTTKAGFDASLKESIAKLDGVAAFKAIPVGPYTVSVPDPGPDPDAGKKAYFAAALRAQAADSLALAGAAPQDVATQLAEEALALFKPDYL